MKDSTGFAGFYCGFIAFLIAGFTHHPIRAGIAAVISIYFITRIVSSHKEAE